jgi:hypothetical protein
VRLRQRSFPARDGYGQLLRAYALPKLGRLPITSISAADVERALSELIGQRTRQGSGTLSPRSIRHVWNTLRIGVAGPGWFGHPSVG